jgi:hypothetical protein
MPLPGQKFINAIGVEVVAHGGATPKAPAPVAAPESRPDWSLNIRVDVFGRQYDDAVPAFLETEDPDLLIDRMAITNASESGAPFGSVISKASLVAYAARIGHTIPAEEIGVAPQWWIDANAYQLPIQTTPPLPPAVPLFIPSTNAPATYLAGEGFDLNWTGGGNPVAVGFVATAGQTRAAANQAAALAAVAAYPNLLESGSGDDTGITLTPKPGITLSDGSIVLALTPDLPFTGTMTVGNATTTYGWNMNVYGDLVPVFKRGGVPVTAGFIIASPTPRFEIRASTPLGPFRRADGTTVSQLRLTIDSEAPAVIPYVAGVERYRIAGEVFRDYLISKLGQTVTVLIEDVGP